jgi:hypothetical protein
LKSNCHVPLQSATVVGEPPELSTTVRRHGGAMHSVPPPKGDAARPLAPKASMPAVWLRTFVARIV